MWYDDDKIDMSKLGRHGSKRMGEVTRRQQELFYEQEQLKAQEKKLLSKVAWKQSKDNMREQKNRINNYKKMLSGEMRMHVPTNKLNADTSKKNGFPDWLKLIHKKSKMGFKPKKGTDINNPQWVRKEAGDTEDYSLRWKSEMVGDQRVWARKKSISDMYPAHVARQLGL